MTRRIAELTVLHQVGEICANANSEDELFERVTKSLTGGLCESNCGFVLLDAQRSCLVAHSSFFLANANVDRSAIPLDKGVIGQVARTGRVQRIGDVRQWAAYWRADPSTLSELCVPLFVNDDVVGVINIERSTINAFSDFDEQLVVTIAKLSSDALTRLRAQHELRASEERYRLLIDSLPAFISYVDKEERYRWVNRTYEDWYQRPRAEIIGKSLRDLQGDEQYHKMGPAVREVLSGRSVRYETTLHDPSGKLRTFDTQYVPHYSETGLVVGFFVLMFEVTERLQSERNLRRSEERFSKLFFASPFSIIVASYPAGKIIDANDAFLSLFGFRRDEVLGKTTGELDIWVSLEDRAEMLQQLASTGSARDMEIVFRTKSGEKITLVMSVEIILLDGEPHSLAMSIDISDRKRAEFQSQQLSDELAHANRVWLLSEISSGLAHELNQPLTAIHLYASSAKILAEQSVAPELVDFLTKIGEQSFRAGEIIRRMRSFVRNTDSTRSEIEINRLVRDVEELLGDYVRQSKVSVDCRFAKGELRSRADGVQIQQVIVNVIRNAVEAMRDVQDRPRVLSIRTELIENEIQISISDTGCGLDPSIAPKLFFPFQTTKSNGLGLGLSICRTLIEAHGGRISASSKLGIGTTFTITLPALP